MNQAISVPPAKDFLVENVLQSNECTDVFTSVNYQKNQSQSQKIMMRITVDVASVSELRKIIVSTCGNLIVYLRIQPVEHARKMQFWLCLSKAATGSIIDNIMRVLPQAEFGRITPAPAA